MSTTQEIIDYYANLLILQYIGKPKAYATIQALVTPIAMDRLPFAVQSAFELETAVGAQLDVIGKYAGVSRSGVGLQGQPIVLDDADFTALIKVAIIRNMAGSSLAIIQELLHNYFPNEIFVYDPQNMSLNYLISSTVGTQDLVQMFVVQKLLPKPMGVQLASVIYLPSLEIFGMSDYIIPLSLWNSGTTYAKGDRAYDADGVVYASILDGNLNHAVSDTDFWDLLYYPFNNYDSYQSGWHWLSYDDGISI